MYSKLLIKYIIMFDVMTRTLLCSKSIIAEQPWTSRIRSLSQYIHKSTYRRLYYVFQICKMYYISISDSVCSSSGEWYTYKLLYNGLSCDKNENHSQARRTKTQHRLKLHTKRINILNKSYITVLPRYLIVASQ